MKEVDPPRTIEERNARLELVMRTIEENPGHWNQLRWHCGSSHCFAGFAQCLARELDWKVNFVENYCQFSSLRTQDFERTAIPGIWRESENLDMEESHYADYDAMRWLGLLTEYLGERYWPAEKSSTRGYSRRTIGATLFNANNTLKDLRRVVDDIKTLPLTSEE